MSEPPRVMAVLMTAPDETVAEQLGRALVERRLAACATVLPNGHSVYWWEGRVQSSPEALVILKTTTDRIEALTQAAVEMHPYDVPEVIALPVEAGHEPYLSWVRGEVTA